MKAAKVNPTRKAASKAQKPAHRSQRWEVINPHAAGIDVGATEHYVAVPPDSVPDSDKAVRSFGALTADLHSMVEWLKACGVTTVAMESTGVYWIAPYQIAESAGLEVLLVNAKAIKHAPRRKTDVSDCQWLQQLHTYGLLSGSFRPDEPICRLRTLVRHRANLVGGASREVQHIQKGLQQMNLHLHHVVSDVMGVTGKRILKAILAGERDLDELLKLRDERISRSTPEEMKKALQGDFRPELLFAVGQALEMYEFLHRQMDACDQQIAQALAQIEIASVESNQNSLAEPQSSKSIPSQEQCTGQGRPAKKKKKARQTRKANDPKIDLKPELTRIFGIDLTETLGLRVLSVLVFLSEVGFDLSRFPNAKAFSAWLGLCPNNKISGGKILSSHTKRVVNRVAVMLRLAAVAIGKTDTCLGWFYRRKCTKLGPAGAATATARKLACILYYLITRREQYVEPDLLAYQQKYHRHRTVKLCKQLETLGYEVELKVSSS
jgi:transposase